MTSGVKRAMLRAAAQTRTAALRDAARCQRIVHQLTIRRVKTTRVRHQRMSPARLDAAPCPPRRQSAILTDARRLSSSSSRRHSMRHAATITPGIWHDNREETAGRPRRSVAARHAPTMNQTGAAPVCHARRIRTVIFINIYALP